MSRPLEDCVVVGAGPAGLAASVALTAQGVDHVVLERDRVGASWRTKRWDSLRVNNPGWMNAMLGPQPEGTFLRATEVVERLEQLAASLPVRASVDLTEAWPDGDAWVLRTSDEEWRSRAVVVATGEENVPRVPALAELVPWGITQLHASQYRRPDGLPDGTVLVVGSGQSGCQITWDLLDAGRDVVLATSPVGRIPRWHRGRDALDVLVHGGYFDQRREDLPDPSVTRLPQSLFAPGSRSLSLQVLAQEGAVLAGRVVGVQGEVLRFDDSVSANVAAGDAVAERIRLVIDGYLAATGEALPPLQPDPADGPVAIEPPMTLDLRAAGIGGVVWCTGYRGAFSWLGPELLDTTGRPRHDGAAAPVPGLWYVGLRWLTRRCSGNFLGFPKDAATVAAAVQAHLASGPSRGRAPL